MDTELDFPPIEAPAAAPAPSTAVATLAAAELDLATLDLETVALSAFGPASAAVATATAKLTGVQHDLSTPTKLADAKSLRHRLINVPLADARKTSAALKSKLTSVSKAVGVKLVAIESDFDAAEKLITPQIDAAQAKLDEEARIKREAEAARVQKHRDALEKLAEPAERSKQPDMTAERIAKGIALVKAIELDEKAWEEFYPRAVEQKAVTLERMQALHAAAVATEEAARLAAEQAAQLKAQQEEAARVAAAQKAEADRLAALAAELARQQAEFAAQQAAAADKAREEAEARAVEAAARAQHEAVAGRIAAEAAKATAPGFKAFKPLPAGVVAGANVNESGQWYAADGTFMNPDGTRSIFCDVDDAGEIEFAPSPAKTNTPEQAPQNVLKATVATPDATDRDAPASTSPSVGSMGAGPAADAAPLAEVATFSLGELQALILPVEISGAGVALLGFEPVETKGRSRLYRVADRDAILLAAITHLQGVRAKAAA